MKILTLLQPWASLLAFGEKRFETRSWQTAYRGPVAIHAGKRFPKTAEYLCTIPPFVNALDRHNINAATQIPRGAIVGVAVIHDCLKVEAAISLPTLPASEQSFGDGRLRQHGLAHHDEGRHHSDFTRRHDFHQGEAVARTIRRRLVRCGCESADRRGAGI